ncbi:tetratricopeptide repeat protein [Actinoplanes sp. NPDC026619]|uniref:BTAD domain-containing putative transcriptional regulator n=1 Tax=Actinoplanes sp. NPDC026619 TaxID=3155798 RepID=UPI00340313D7
MAAEAHALLRTHGCRLIVAAAGYGKTAFLRTGSDEGPVAYHSAAGTLPDRLAVDSAGTPAALVVIDDAGALGPAARLRLAATLRALPDTVQICLASREPWDGPESAALPQPVVEFGAADVALPMEAVAAVLGGGYRVVDGDVCEQVVRLTAGWPALVGYAADVLDRCDIGDEALLAALTGPGTPAGGWLREQVLAPLRPELAELLRALAGLDPVTVPLCQELADAGLLGNDAGMLGNPAWVGAGLRRLVRTGLVVPHRHRAGPAYRVVPALAALLVHDGHWGGGGGAGQRERERLGAAADWYQRNGLALAAADTLSRGGGAELCASLIETDGEAMVAEDGARTASLIQALPADRRSVRLRTLLGDALRVSGDATAALRTFEPLLVDAGHAPAGLLWRAAMAHYMRSDYPAALELCDRHRIPAPATVDEVLLVACRVNTLTQLGRPEWRELVPGMLAAAQASGDDRALAAAHLAAALEEFGGRRDAHLAQARTSAERGGDLSMLARVLLNQAEGLLRDARFAEAADVAARAIGTAEAAGAPPGMRTVALYNAGEALTRLGRFDDAVRHFDRVVRVARRHGLNRMAQGLVGLGEVYHLLGQLQRSRAALEEAADLARATDERQVLIPALGQLVRVLLAGPEPDPAAARAAAEEAERLASPRLASLAFAACGWVALAEHDIPLAGRRAEAAVRAARANRRLDCLAEALELAGVAEPEPGRARATLCEAEAIWRRGGAAPAADRVLVSIGRLRGADGADRAAGKAAAQRLRALGVDVPDGGSAPSAAATGVQIRVLGRFEVLVRGRLVSLPAWRSRQARSLLKILVARRGRRVARDELCELLWPDDAGSGRTGHRLSVLLSVIRGVLDPSRLLSAEHYIEADGAGMSLNTGHVLIDAEELLRDAALAAELRREGRHREAREILAEVDARYLGDAFDDEPYEDWANGLREEVRAAWLRSLRQLATISARDGDPDQAVTSLTRLCGADLFDESAHQMLVTVLVGAGRHGEARRAFERWTRAMRSIDAPPPDRGLLRGVQRSQAAAGPVSEPAGPRSLVRSRSPR